jgi:hypothetical protein
VFANNTRKDTGLNSCVENSKARNALEHIEGLDVDETMILKISDNGVAWTDLAQSWDLRRPCIIPTR